jgi:hypothetical protein
LRGADWVEIATLILEDAFHLFVQRLGFALWSVV